MNKISNRRLARGFVAEINKDGANVKSLIKELASYIIESKKVSQLQLILNDISLELEKQNGITNASVFSAHQLNTALKADIVKLIKKQTGSDKVNITETIEPSLLGGVRIEMPNKEIDLSIKHKLKSLEAYK